MTAAAEPLGVIPGETPSHRLPRAAEIFGRRAARLRALATGHAAGEWLAALAEICAAQHAAIALVTDRIVPARLPRSGPLCATEWRRSGAWRAALALILERLATVSLPAAAREAILRLRCAPELELEAMADALLSARGAATEPATLPFLAAALQVYFTALAEQLGDAALEPSTRGCPVCRAPPVAAAIQGDDKVRYLRCSLCGTDWHLVRVQCTTCGSGARLSYAGVDGAGPGTRAEVCGDCKTYLKIVALEDLPGAEPLADDAASLALDILLGEEGYSRGGVNLLVAAPASERASAAPNLQA